MRCSSCGYISFDHFASCAKCESDLTGTADFFRGTATDAEAPFFLGSVVNLSEDRAVGADLGSTDGAPVAMDTGLDFTLGSGFEDEGELSELTDEPFEEPQVEPEVEIEAEAEGAVEEAAVEEETLEVASEPDLEPVTEDAADLTLDAGDDEEFDIESMFEPEEEDSGDAEPDMDLSATGAEETLEVAPEPDLEPVTEDAADLALDAGGDEEFDIESMFESEEEALYGKEQEAELDLDLGVDASDDSAGPAAAEEDVVDFDLSDLGSEEVELSDNAAAGEESSELEEISIDDDEGFDFSSLGSMDTEDDGELDSVDFSALGEDGGSDDHVELDISLDEISDDASPEPAVTETDPVAAEAKKTEDIVLNLEVAAGEDLGAKTGGETEKPDIPDLGLTLESDDE